MFEIYVGKLKKCLDFLRLLTKIDDKMLKKVCVFTRLQALVHRLRLDVCRVIKARLAAKVT